MNIGILSRRISVLQVTKDQVLAKLPRVKVHAFAADVTIQAEAASPVNFCVWLSSPEAAFTADMYLFANWDIDELKARAEEISSSTLLEMWPEGVISDVNGRAR